MPFQRDEYRRGGPTSSGNHLARTRPPKITDKNSEQQRKVAEPSNKGVIGSFASFMSDYGRIEQQSSGRFCEKAEQ